jgi:endoribonuclease LACTB2
MRIAVSIILRCQNEVLMIRRQNFLKAFGGYTAFPGGKIDREDERIEVQEQFPEIEPTHFQALRRELLEECGVKLEEIAKSIESFGKAQTPDFNPIRFDNYFYLVDCAEKPSFVFDPGEVAEGSWKSAQAWIQQYELGKILIVPPILMALKQLQHKKSGPHFLDYQYPEDEVPTIESISGLVQIMPLSPTLPPATRTNSFLIGDDKKILMDPSPVHSDELLKFKRTLEHHSFDAIFLTHHHGDHHHMLPEFLKIFPKPIFLSKECHELLLKKKGKNYFAGASLNFLEDKMEVCQWMGQPVRAYHLPGHDQSMYGLAPDDMSWFMVSDLIQTLGTVVIGGEESDMDLYLQSLKRVIDLRPRCIMPSHGIILGGVDLLEKTYQHRLDREQQVISLLKQGKSVDEMLDLIYFDLKENLRPYARENILSHMKRIKKHKLA